MSTHVDPTLVEQFRWDGYVIVPDLLDAEELARYGALVNAAVAERKAPDQRTLAEKSRYEQSFTQCMNLWEDHASIRPLTFHQGIGQAAAELLGADAVRIWHDQALYKDAGGRGTDAHQDHPYWPMAETASVTAWIPFEGSTIASGALGYVAGSHAIGLRKFVNIFFGEPEDLLADPEIAGLEPTFVEVPAGSVAFHHGLTVHLSKPNTTDAPRAVHTVIFFPDGATRGYPFPHFAVDRGGIEVGQPIASDVTPIAWPRTDLPGAPSQPWDTTFVLSPGLIPGD